MSNINFEKIDWSYSCPKCHKPRIYVGDVPEGGFIKGQEPYCTCDEKKEEFNPVGYGWVCPICGTVNAPWVSQCPGNHYKTVTTSSTTW